MAEYNPSKIIKDGNTYNFRDTTKIPLAGSNQISGDLIPSTDNSIDIGSSTKNIKMLYTKGITIDSKTVDTIEEQGTGYIRYTSGIQICWGNISFTSSSHPWGGLYESSIAYGNYPKSFISAPVVTAGSSGENYCVVESARGDTARTPDFFAVKPASFTNLKFNIGYIAIGMWK